jgi:hypothetical protein
MQAPRFYGWTVVAAAFVVAIFGWGVGFYGPPIFLKAVQDTRGWPTSIEPGRHHRIDPGSTQSDPARSA